VSNLKGKVLSFTASLVIASVAVSVVLMKNPRLRAAIEQQIEDCLEIVREKVEQFQKTIETIQGPMRAIDEKKQETIAENEQKRLAAYDEEWNKHIWS